MASVKLDENVPDSVGVILRERGHDVALARDEQLAGAGDDQILAVANSEGRVLVSLDRDFTNILRHPPEATAGIVVSGCHNKHCRSCDRQPIRWATCFPENPRAVRLWVLDESRLRIWPRGVNGRGDE